MKIDEFKDRITPHLKTDFENNLLEAVLYNLVDKENKIRFNNFSYSIRELTRHILKRLSSDENVRKCSWFVLHDSEKPDMITRKQRMKYAIQAGLSDSYILEKLDIDTNDICKTVNKVIDKLSKYTHIQESTFDISEAEVNNLSKEVMATVILLFDKIEESRKGILEELTDAVDKSVLSELFHKTHDSIDYLATHHNVEEYTVDEIRIINIDDSTITFQANGSVNVRLQYGSDGDIRRGDGHEMYDSFPFSGIFYGDIKDDMKEFTVDAEEFIVNTDEFFGDEDGE